MAIVFVWCQRPVLIELLRTGALIEQVISMAPALIVIKQVINQSIRAIYIVYLQAIPAHSMPAN